MTRIRVHAKLSRLRPIPVKRALAQTTGETPAYDLVDERHMLPWLAIVGAVLIVVDVAGFVVAMVVAA